MSPSDRQADQDAVELRAAVGASAVLAAIDLDSLVLKWQPGLYGGLACGGPVIPI